MKRIFFFLFIGLLGMTSFQSCDYGDTNIDPTRPTDVDLNLMLPEAITQSAYNQSANPARISGIFMQQFFGFDAQQVAYNQYQVGEDVMNNYWRGGLYAGVLKSCQTIIDKAVEQEAPYYEGMARVLMAHNLGLATSYFGDIPFSDAFGGEDNLQPAYDSQEQIYASVQTMLDDAIRIFEAEGGPIVPGADDLYFGGDVSGWIAYANALKARYMVHVSNRGGDWNMIADLAEQGLAATPVFTYGSAATNNNPLAKFGQERPNTLIINDYFANRMTDAEDPRQPAYMEFNGTNWIYYNGANPDLKWAAAAASIPAISNVELNFYIAEAAYRNGEDATDALTTAIESSMALNGVDSTAAAPYVAAMADLSGLSGEEVLERIINEAYTAYYGIAFSQTWTNFRRTGYPDLVPNELGQNGLNPSGVVPRRFLYPVSEAQTNSSNREAAVSNQGGALLDNGLWAF